MTITPYLVIYKQPNGRYNSVIVNADTEENARKKFQAGHPGTEIISTKPFGCAF